MTREESIKNSQEKYKKIKEKNKKEKQERKEGIAYIHENKNIDCFKLDIHCYSICIAYSYDPKSEIVSLSMCYQSPKDEYSARIAKGLLGNRMKNEDKKFFAKLPISIDDFIMLRNKRAMRFFVASSFISNALIEKNVPDCIRRDIKAYEYIYFCPEDL
jgi:hypothetical protein